MCRLSILLTPIATRELNVNTQLQSSTFWNVTHLFSRTRRWPLPPQHRTRGRTPKRCTLLPKTEHTSGATCVTCSVSPADQGLRSYAKATRSHLPGPERPEAIEMSRRALPNDAAELLRERFSTKVSVDKDTARRLSRSSTPCFRGKPHRGVVPARLDCAAGLCSQRIDLLSKSNASSNSRRIS
ncbi:MULTISPECIES: UPF0262 family protein [unclassified Mesorhizobium]|uniref:UPF0262 family protein n=1 Tax=unclassified Mesorhizobium TaxID=325217 RepID=UPI00333D06D4